MSKEELKATATALLNFNMQQINKRQVALDNLPRRQKLMYDSIPKMAKMGKIQRQLIAGDSFMPRHKHKILLMYNPECRHCLRVKILVNKYVALHKEVLLIEMDVTSKERTDYLMAVTKGNLDVPAVMVDDTYIFQGETNFLERLTTAIQLSEVTLTPRSIEQQWITRGF